MIMTLVHASDVERPWLQDNGATPEISLFEAESAASRYYTQLYFFIVSNY